MSLSQQAKAEIAKWPLGYDLTPFNIASMAVYMTQLRSWVIPLYLDSPLGPTEEQSSELFDTHIMSSTIRELLQGEAL